MASFGAGHAGERAFECARAARSNFDYDDQPAFLRDEIDLDVAQADVGPEDAEALRLEKVRNRFLRAVAVASAPGLFLEGLRQTSTGVGSTPPLRSPSRPPGTWSPCPSWRLRTGCC